DDAGGVHATGIHAGSAVHHTESGSYNCFVVERVCQTHPGSYGIRIIARKSAIAVACAVTLKKEAPQGSAGARIRRGRGEGHRAAVLFLVVGAEVVAYA